MQNLSLMSDYCLIYREQKLTPAVLSTVQTHPKVFYSLAGSLFFICAAQAETNQCKTERWDFTVAWISQASPLISIPQSLAETGTSLLFFNCPSADEKSIRKAHVEKSSLHTTLFTGLALSPTGTDSGLSFSTFYLTWVYMDLRRHMFILMRFVHLSLEMW